MDERSNAYALPGVAETVEDLHLVGPIIANASYFLIIAILVIYLVHKLARKFLYPRLANKRHAMVLIGAMHAMVLAVSLLLVLGRLGFDISLLAPPLILIILVGAVIVLFIGPFLPSLPFVLGNMVEIGGVMGIVETINPIFTRLQTFDGRTVFIPNALVWAKNIVNYHHTATRRIELNLNVSANHSISGARSVLLDIMTGDERVVDDPAPVVRLNGASAECVDVVGLCWVSNADFLDARSDLYERVVKAAQNTDGITLSLRKQEVLLSGQIAGRQEGSPET